MVHDGTAGAGESIDAYLERSSQLQFALIAKGIAAIGGNQIVIDHGNGEFSFYAHLKPGSLLVKPGDRVQRGQRIAAVGGSGNSTEPHLHFHVCDSADLMRATAIPIRWKEMKLLLPEPPRAPQTGDLLGSSSATR